MAYESTTLADIYKQVAFDLDAALYMPTAFVDTVAAQSVTSANLFLDTGSGSGKWRDMGGGFYRGSATAAGKYRPVGDLTNSTGLLAQAGTAWTGGDASKISSENILLVYHGIRPDLDWLPLINQVLKEEYLATNIGISHLSKYDGDMSKTTDTDWTVVGTLSAHSKSTIDTVTPWGMKSYLTTTSAVNSGTRSTAIPLAQARYYSMFTIASCSGSSTASLQPWNSTVGSTVGMPAAITHSEIEPQLMAIRNQHAPTTCHSVAMNMLNTVSGTSVYWNQAWLYNLDNLVIDLPTYVSEHFKAPSIFQMIPRFSTSTTGQSVWNAQGVDMVPLTEGQDYSFSFHQADANPYQVVFADRSAYQWPLFVEAKRPWYDIVASGAGFVDDTSTFGGSLMSLLPKIELKLLDKLYLPRLGSKMPKWGVLRNQIAGDLAKAAEARIMKPLAGPRPYFHGVGHA